MATDSALRAGVQDAAIQPTGIAGHGPVALDAAPGTYAQRAAIDDGTLETLRQANGAFLALVARRAAGEGSGDTLGLPAEVAARIAAQDATTRRFAAECPYTLFNVRFEDAAFWRGIAAGASAGETRAAPRADADEPRFVLTAVFLAWHLARQGDLSAALVLGMTPAVREAWRALPLQVLDAVAASTLPHLRARWGGHARFWPQLLDAAERPAVDHAERVRLLGLQLLATDGCRTTLPRRARRPA
jgi:hypothetical protein